MSAIVKAAKKIKKILRPASPFISFSRRINYVRTDKRICAMTFDDGPMLLPASPDAFGGKGLTEILLDTLDSFGAKGTFDIIGTTAHNYPDTQGALGSASWGGVKFDHYPDFSLDHMGGALKSDECLRRIISSGHTLSNHGYRHIIFGKKPFVYGAREHFDNIGEVIEDTQKLNDYIFENYAYKITMGRPAHYVDKISGGFTSYDAYSFLGMQYLGASFDGGGWLPEKDIEAETNAMIAPLKRALEEDPDCFCGKIIFQKDGYNMAKRTPVAFALKKQLELLYQYGYTVVGVDKLMEHSRFSDIMPSHPLYEKLCTLSDTHACIFSDNCARLEKNMTKGEFALLFSQLPDNPMPYRQLQKTAVEKLFGKKLNPASNITQEDLLRFKNLFNDMPKSTLRGDIINQIII